MQLCIRPTGPTLVVGILGIALWTLLMALFLADLGNGPARPSPAAQAIEARA